MKTRRGGGIFGVPGGEAKFENPDGVSMAYADGQTRNSLRNSSYACGGPDGGGYGWAIRDDEGPSSAATAIFVTGGSRDDKFRVK